ncbi:unnamed protein product [Fusarium equiseti]|uniref:Uncharacterized protein n=1 Tax=Fusarium equiseti TaxID=61235 RepID=A0A8J2IUS9_FUSEQ|nr:unnamed protein product [Fusarium equiseti]
MSAIASYSYGNFAWLATQAVPLILWPSFVGSLLRSEGEPSSQAPDGAPSPYASAAVLVSTLHSVSSAFYCYGRFAWTGETGFLLGCVGSAIFATFGLYCVMFAGDKAMTSRYHKFDQSTSGFPFKNSQSYRAKKKAL